MMRFIFTMFTIPLLVLSSIAQKEELPQYKKWFAGGSFNFDYYTNEVEDQFGINKRKSLTVRIRPSAGFQINRHWLIGISPAYVYGYRHRETSMQVNYTGETHEYGGRIFARYLYSWHPQWHIYLQPYAGYHYATRRDIPVNPNSHKYSNTVLSLGVVPGISYTIKEKIRLITSFGRLLFQHDFKNNDEEFQNTSTRFDLDLGLSSIYFGMEFLF